MTDPTEPPRSQPFPPAPGAPPGAWQPGPPGAWQPGPPGAWQPAPPGWPAVPGPYQVGPVPVFAPPKRRRTGLIVGISLGAVALLCLCIVAGLGSLGGLAYFGYRLDRADAIGALDDYLSDVVAQRYDEAYGQLCGSVRARHSLPDFESQMRETGLTSYHIGGDTYTTRDQESGYLIDVDETLATGATMPRKYFVVGGGYDICPTHL